MNNFRLDVVLLLLLVLSSILGCSASAPVETNQLNFQGLLQQHIRHIVVIVQENRSFDNLFSGFPGADSATTGMSYGQVVPLDSVPLGYGIDVDHTHPGCGQTGTTARTMDLHTHPAIPCQIILTPTFHGAKSSSIGLSRSGTCLRIACFNPIPVRVLVLSLSTFLTKSTKRTPDRAGIMPCPDGTDSRTSQK